MGSHTISQLTFSQFLLRLSHDSPDDYVRHAATYLLSEILQAQKREVSAISHARRKSIRLTAFAPEHPAMRPSESTREKLFADYSRLPQQKKEIVQKEVDVLLKILS